MVDLTATQRAVLLAMSRGAAILRDIAAHATTGPVAAAAALRRLHELGFAEMKGSRHVLTRSGTDAAAAARALHHAG